MKRLFLLLLLLVCTFLAQAQTVIQMEKIGGVYYVPCTVNGLKLQFIFDTGASDVSISLSEAIFMIKNGYISENDLIGTEYYRIANGEVAEGTKLIIRKLEIGGKILIDVRASIVHSTTAPLLLGQSVLERFGSVGINYANQTLTLDDKTIVSSQSTSHNKPSTSDSNIVQDIDGNSYKTVKIGTQVWMSENLRARSFANGDEISNEKDDKVWSSLVSSAWAYYNNLIDNKSAHGKIYNWRAATDGRNVCPVGWHLPSDSEWEALINYLGGEVTALKKL
jgi:clan AA aspartic protease (TIGR02281 family)